MFSNNTYAYTSLPHALPRWDNCSAEANTARDDLVDYFSNRNETYYSHWEKGQGCLHGSAMDQVAYLRNPPTSGNKYRSFGRFLIFLISHPWTR